MVVDGGGMGGVWREGGWEGGKEGLGGRKGAPEGGAERVWRGCGSTYRLTVLVFSYHLVERDKVCVYRVCQYVSRGWGVRWPTAVLAPYTTQWPPYLANPLSVIRTCVSASLHALHVAQV